MLTRTPRLAVIHMGPVCTCAGYRSSKISRVSKPFGFQNIVNSNQGSLDMIRV